jgi:hypothetical protein
MKRILIILFLCSQVLGVTTILNSFNAGELSPYLEGRTDLEKYYSGCKTLENFLVLSYGGAQRRPGSVYIGPVKNQAAATRVISFEYSTTQAYIIEMGNLYMRFYRDQGRIQTGATPAQITTPYVTADLWEIQFIQSADTMYLVHPTYPPRTLTRSSHTAWTLTEFETERGPFKDDNTTSTTITPSGTTGSITLTASTSIFNANHVGALWKVTHTVDANEAHIALTTGGAQNSTENTVHLGRRFDFSTHGTWTGTVILQRSYDSGVTWKDVRPVHYEDDGNITYTDTETVDDAVYRIHKDATAISSGTCNANFIVRSFDVEGVVDITAYTSGTEVTGTVDYTLGDTSATDVWAEGAFSPDEGYPSALAFYQERLCFAGTTNQPQTIWMSVTDDWTNFLDGTDDSSALTWTIASDQVNVIRWLAPQSALLIGTVGAEWRLSASDTDKPVTPTNVEVRRQSSYGSAYIQPAMLNNTVLFAQRQAKKIRELVFSFAEDAWVSPDLTVLAEHITGTGITEMALQKTPDPVLWCVRSDGQLCALTYQKDHDVIGWSRHTLSGTVESVAVIPGSGEDEIWCTVSRTVNNQTVRYIEQFGGREWTSQQDAIYVDSALTWDGGAAVNITDITLASPGVVTAPDHGFSDGDQVRITDLSAMGQINNRVFTVNSPTRNTFALRDRTDAVDWDTTGGSVVSHTETPGAGVPTRIFVGGEEWEAQVFIAPSNFYITRVDIYGSRQGLPGTAMLEIRNVNSTTGQPEGEALASQSLVINSWPAIAFPTTEEWQQFDLSPNPLLAGNGSYAIVISVPTGSNLDSRGLHAQATDTGDGDTGYSDGTMWGSNDWGGDGTWTNSGAIGRRDILFRIYGSSAPASAYSSGGYVTQAENTFSGLNHLEGETVDVVGDGGDVPGTYTVSNGAVTIGTDDEDYYNTVHIGLPFTAYLETMRLELPTTGTIQGKTKRVTELTLRLVDSLGGKVGSSFTSTDMDSLIFRDADDTLEQMTPLYSGDKQLSFPGGYDTDYSLFVMQDEPLPFTLTALIPEFESER